MDAQNKVACLQAGNAFGGQKAFGDVTKAILVAALENCGIFDLVVMDFGGSPATAATISGRRHQKALHMPKQWHNPRQQCGYATRESHIFWQEVRQLTAKEWRRSVDAEG